MRQRLLLVEDEPAVRRSVAETLEAEGVEVHLACSAEEALDRLTEVAPEVVLTDVRMPGMDGLALLRLLRERVPDVDVVVMTAFDDMPTVVQAMRDGAYAGLQTSGDRFARQVHFAVWDAAGVDAVVVDAADSVCDPFGGEGTGQKCRFAYPWRVGDQYRFEMVAEVSGGRTDYTVVFEDVTQGITRAIATIRYGREANLSWVTAFVEDFGPLSSSCLTTHARSARLAQRERLSGGNWIRIEQARFMAVDDLSHCANVIVSEEEGGIRFGTGGTL